MCKACNTVRMKNSFAILVFLLTALTGVLSRAFFCFPYCPKWSSLPLYLNLRLPIGILGGPIGPITFTALSTRSINIQIDRGSDPGQYHLFTIRRDNWDTACNIPVHGILTDCTDGHARHGNNHYRIGASFPGGSWVPDNYYANTLQQDRTHFLALT